MNTTEPKRKSTLQHLSQSKMIKETGNGLLLFCPSSAVIQIKTPHQREAFRLLKKLLLHKQGKPPARVFLFFVLLGRKIHHSCAYRPAKGEFRRLLTATMAIRPSPQSLFYKKAPQKILSSGFATSKTESRRTPSD